VGDAPERARRLAASVRYYLEHSGEQT